MPDRFFEWDETPFSLRPPTQPYVRGLLQMEQVFTHFLIRSRKTGRLADLLVEATLLGPSPDVFCEPSPATR